MKIMKKISALVIAMVMVLAMALPAMAGEMPGVANEHTITIANADEQATHVYEAYQIFKGNLDAAEAILSDIQWGAGVNGNALLTALKAESFANRADFANAADAAGVAKVLAGYGDDSDKLFAFADLAAKNLTTPSATSTQNASQYSVVVPNDGYYLVKDKDDSVTADGETYTRYMLNVIKDQTITAKDTHTNSDKNIKEADGDLVNDNDVAIGDTINYVSTLDDVPDPARYNRFKLEMQDTMEKGLTFTGLGDIVLNKGDTTKTLTFGTDYYFYVDSTLYNKDNAFTAPAKPVDDNAPTGATSIKIVFINAKDLITNFAGGTLTVNYTAVLNKNAEIAPASNDNTVKFVYSNNPNNVYEGDEITNDDVKGETPDKTVETYTTTLTLKKVDGTGKALEGAEFEITGAAFNTTLVTAEVFEVATDGTYWLLKDGSYTTTDPNTVTNKTQYAEPLTTKYKKVQQTKVVKTPVNTKYVVTSGEGGIIKLEGIKEGTYTIKETKAPDGYNLLTDVTTLVIDWDYVHAIANRTSPTDEEKTTANGGFLLGNGSSDGWTMTGNGASFEISIQNNQGSTLPSTGGIGTTIFYVIGGILVVLAGIVLVSKRKSAE